MLKLANLFKLYTFVSIENNKTGINHNTRMK